MGIPAYLLNPDAIPGRANRRLARLVRAVFAQWSDTVSHGHFQHCRVRVHGCPVRTTFRTAQRTDGQQRFGLSPSLRTLLITGASQGARTINEAVTANSAFLASLSGWQILHLTGEADFESVKGAYKAGGVHATVIPFTHHMPEALAVADLVISRAGASTLAEITALGRASILMPYPFHRDRHQTANALCLVRRNAAVFVEDSKTAAVNAPRLLAALRSATADGEQRDAMAKAARALGKPGAAERIVDDIIALGAQRGSVIASESLEVSSCGIR
jgi:UDP-N-acetylglucosamine--N-acetylmuramyl-(pentapeptide) pyrophosphoryl-undecaprenol N-acetylglucosamine transferase